MVNQSCILKANQAAQRERLAAPARNIALYICLLYNL